MHGADEGTFAAASRGPRGEPGMVRLFVNVGRNQGARPQDFVGAIANEAGIPGRAIGAIDIFDDYAFVDVPREFVERVLAAMRGAKIKGRPVNIEIARPDGVAAPQERGGFRRRPSGTGRPPFVGGARVNRDGEDRPPRRYERSGGQQRGGAVHGQQPPVGKKRMLAGSRQELEQRRRPANRGFSMSSFVPICTKAP